MAAVHACEKCNGTQLLLSPYLESLCVQPCNSERGAEQGACARSIGDYTDGGRQMARACMRAKVPWDNISILGAQWHEGGAGGSAHTEAASSAGGAFE